MLTEDQVIQRIRTELHAELDGIHPAANVFADAWGHAHADPSGRGRSNWGGLIAATVSVAAVVVVALVALSIRGHRPTAPAVIPAHLPFSSPVSPAGTGGLAHTSRLIQTFPDPQSGPAWGVRTYQTRNGMTCVQGGRTEAGVVGAIGIDGAYGGDMRFHPFALTRVDGLGDCVPNDAHGHAFINVATVNSGASAGQQPCLQHDVALPREHCSATALRDVYFGLLGPDATSITYVGAGGRQVVQHTRGRDGAYLVVRPLAPGSCNRASRQRLGGPSSCNYDAQGEMLGATLRSGEITAVSYRDGHVCHLPVPHGVFVRLAQCPVVGYVAAPGPRYSPAQITAPVTVRKLPARYYCQHPGIYRSAALAIPCDGAVPHGYARVQFTPSRHSPGYDTGQNLLVYISWTAHGAVKTTSRSTYNVSISYPKSCGAGGQGTGTQSRIRAGEHVTRYFFVPARCRGTSTGYVTYIPNLGPDGQNGRLVGAGPGNGAFLVGAFTLTVP